MKVEITVMTLRTNSFRPNVDETLKKETQKVYALRKSGNISEAYQLAQQLHSNHSGDEWVTKALAWVLVSKINNSLDCNPHCQNSCHPHLNNPNGEKGDNHGTIQCRTQTSYTEQTFIT